MTLLLGAGAVVVALVFVASLEVPVTDDEAWFLQVLQRCRGGDVLYRDVFYGAGPLPVWIALVAVRLGRPQMLVLRAMHACYFVALLLAGSWLLAALDAGPWATVVLWIASVAYAGPSWGIDNHYGQVAMLTTTLAAGAIAERAAGGAVWWVALAGAAAGCALSSKQNVGLVTVVALGTVATFQTPRASDGAVFAAAALAAAAACLVPVARQRALRDYVLRAYRNKVTYLATGFLWPREGILTLLRSGERGSRFGSLGVFVTISSFAILPLAGIAGIADAVVLLSADRAPASRTAAALGLALAVVALAAAFPRVDASHVQGLFPLGAVAVLCSARALDGPTVSSTLASIGWAAAAVAVAWTGVALVVSLDTFHRVRLPDRATDRRVPHFRGVPVARRTPGPIADEVRALREATEGRVFLLRPDAALWYLAGGLRNPTPYDYPYASTFGPNGQGETIRRIRAGEITWVCAAAPFHHRLEPEQLRRFVAQEMDEVAETPAGTLYRAAPPPGVALDASLGRAPDEQNTWS